jgi:hypothetical protein
MKEIILTKNQVTQVTDERYDFLNQWEWCAQWNKGTKSYYAVRGVWINKKVKMIYMHRLILDLPEGIKGDHKNGITLDNQDDNLRPDPENRNNQNQKLNSRNTSRIKFQSKQHHIGYFDIKEDAVRAYNKKALELHGEFARLNIIK